MLSRFFAATVLLLSLGVGASLSAAEVRYPQEKPRFTIEVPEGWQATIRDETLVLQPTAAAGFQLEIAPAGAAQEGLPERAARIAGEMKLTELDLGTPAEAENQHKVVQTVLTSRGKRGGTPFALTLVAFSIHGVQYIGQAAGATEANRKHNVALLTMMDSIKPAPAAE
jgi:hypothetical protein